jgi:hypothetical protein
VIGPTEPLTRFIVDADHFNASRSQVKYRAFWPRPSEQELSIMRIDGLQPDDVWSLGDTIVAAGRTILARADFVLAAVRNARANHTSLDVIPDEPPPRHALIVGWPREEREIRKSLAQQVASAARLAVR